jgi:hypothetical protein
MMSVATPPGNSVSIRAWIGVDLDGTLAEYHGWKAWDNIGPVIAPMKERILRWLAEGHDVRIFTARVAYAQDTCYVTGANFSRAAIVQVIQNWLEVNGLPRLAVTHEKDFQMRELWDDRCVQVIPNTGRTLAEEHEAERLALTGKAIGSP